MHLTTIALTTLINNYLELVRSGHHKDKDCHFSVQKKWSYGKFLGYRVVHYGYVNCERDGESAFFPTEALAENHLKQLLICWIREEESRRKDSPDQ